MATLRWRGASGDAERELDAPVIRIGRGTENEMVVDEAAVSRLHGAVDVSFLLSEQERTGGEAATTRRVAERTVRLTPAETEVLELLFLHYDAGRIAPRVASIREIAEARFTSTAAVKMALQALYDKFELAGTDERNKEALALRAQQWKMTRTRF
jgi:hypothetical protein